MKAFDILEEKLQDHQGQNKRTKIEHIEECMEKSKDYLGLFGRILICMPKS